ncbi:MAG: antitoxin [Desulfarculaceae bacterium]|nr:antitoxin [Desulfarculaceae bacterium]
MKKIIAISMAVLLCGFLALGCESEGPAEKAGKQIDKAVEKTGEKVEEATDKMGGAVEKAGDKVQEATN